MAHKSKRQDTPRELYFKQMSHWRIAYAGTCLQYTEFSLISSAGSLRASACVQPILPSTVACYDLSLPRLIHTGGTAGQEVPSPQIQRQLRFDFRHYHN